MLMGIIYSNLTASIKRAQARYEAKENMSGKLNIKFENFKESKPKSSSF